MRKHRYGYLKEIVVRRADNDLYRFKEGDFPRLRIIDIEYMLLLVVQNRLTNISSDDISDFAIALRMFTRSLVIHKKTLEEYSNSLLSANDKGRGRKQYRGQKQNKASKDKEIHMAIGDYDDALVCCVKNTIEDHIMHSGASFHATYFKEELERFRLRSGKVCLADGKTLDMVGVGDVVLKTSFDHGNKHRILYMVEVPSNGINITIDGRDNATLWHRRLPHMSEKGIKILALKGRIPDLQNAIVECLKSDNGGEYSSREFIEYCAENGFRMLKIVPKTPQENDVFQRMNRMLNEKAKSMRLHAGLSMMFWEDSVNMISYLINSRPSVPLAF
ncbi:retrovirus-related pol polyprotein from transposon TNT 1-94 [Tanacetum coccineum]